MACRDGHARACRTVSTFNRVRVAQCSPSINAGRGIAWQLVERINPKWPAQNGVVAALAVLVVAMRDCGIFPDGACGQIYKPDDRICSPMAFADHRDALQRGKRTTEAFEALGATSDL